MKYKIMARSPITIKGATTSSHAMAIAPLYWRAHWIAPTRRDRTTAQGSRDLG
jgi:hypothetical protein